MTETEQWIEQAKDYLKTAHRAGGDARAQRLKDDLQRITLEQIQDDLGCGDDCVRCSWGSLGGQSLGTDPCRLLVLQDGIDGLCENDSRKSAIRKEAARLLELLETLPQHHS